MLLPLKNPRSTGSGLSLWDMTRTLESYRKTGVSQRILRRQHRQRQRCRNCGLKLAPLAQRTNQPMMSLDVIRIDRDGFTKGTGRSCWIAFRQQVNAAMRPFLSG